MKINTYLTFNGDCEKAFQFYAEHLGGKIEAMFPFAGTPAEEFTPPEWKDKIMHATLSVGDALLMGSDAPGGRFEKPQGFSVSLQIPDPAEAERVFDALAANGQVIMPLEKTFWAEKFGMLVDPFGIPWMINCEAKQ
jgi:PhnB protein